MFYKKKEKGEIPLFYGFAIPALHFEDHHKNNTIIAYRLSGL